MLRESSRGDSSGLRVRLEGSLKAHYDVYLLLANAYLLLANAYSLCKCVLIMGFLQPLMDFYD